MQDEGRLTVKNFFISPDDDPDEIESPFLLFAIHELNRFGRFRD
jgi:hypothetical protein